MISGDIQDWNYDVSRAVQGGKSRVRNNLQFSRSHNHNHWSWSWSWS